MHRTICYAHPGTYMSQSMTQTLKEECDHDPYRKKALDKLIADTPTSHIPTPLAIVDIGYGGIGTGHKESTKDAEIAVSAALLLWATNDKKYYDIAARILKSWASTNTVWKGDNALLEASWVLCSMARAAELLKYSVHGSLYERDVAPTFIKWIDNVMMPVLKSQHIWKWPCVNNWHFSQICARMQIAILREDDEEFNWCTSTFASALNKALIFKKCPGETTETCRDVTHNQMQLGGIVQAAEMALHQGVSLYDARMVACFELQARIMMREIPNGLTKDDIKAPYGYWYEPVWHIAHTHFSQRLKIPMPKTEEYIKQITPDRVCFHWGPNCLTHHKRKYV